MGLQVTGEAPLEQDELVRFEAAAVCLPAPGLEGVAGEPGFKLRRPPEPEELSMAVTWPRESPRTSS